MEQLEGIHATKHFADTNDLQTDKEISSQGSLQPQAARRPEVASPRHAASPSDNDSDPEAAGVFEHRDDRGVDPDTVTKAEAEATRLDAGGSVYGQSEDEDAESSFFLARSEKSPPRPISGDRPGARQDSLSGGEREVV